MYGIFNFIMKDGTRSHQNTCSLETEDKYIALSEVRRIDIYSEYMQDVGNRMNCFMLYDKDS